MEETPKRPKSEQPPRPKKPGSPVAVSSSADNAGREDTLTPASRSEEQKPPEFPLDQTMVPPSHGDETVMIPSGGHQKTRAGRTQMTGGWADAEPELPAGTVLANRYEILSVLG